MYFCRVHEAEINRRDGENNLCARTGQRTYKYVERLIEAHCAPHLHELWPRSKRAAGHIHATKENAQTKHAMHTTTLVLLPRPLLYSSSRYTDRVELLYV